jgi:MFS family permease
LVLEGLFARLSFGLISFTLPLYARHLGFTLSEIGVLVALNTGVSLAMKPLMGAVADRVGTRNTLLAGIGLRSVVAGLLGFVSAPWHLYAVRGVHGLSMSLRDPSVNALLAEEGGDKQVASAFAWYQTAKSLAGQLSKSAAGMVLAMTASDYRKVFLIAFALSILPGLVVSLYVKRRGPAPPAPRLALVTGEAPVARRPNVVPFMGLGFLVRGTADMVDGFVPIIATEYAGLTPGQTGLVYAVATGVLVMSGPLFGWLADHVSSGAVLSVRAAANTVSSAVYAMAPGPAGVLAAKTLDDMGKAAYRPAWGALMARVSSADPASRARTMSWLTVGEDLGAVLAPAVAGIVWSTWGLPVVMAARAGMALLTEAYTFGVTRQARLKPPGSDPAIPGPSRAGA